MRHSNLTDYFTLNRLGYMFYLVNPKEHAPERIEDVPDYFSEVLPLVSVFILLEVIMDYRAKKPTYFQDVVSDVAYIKLLQLTKMAVKGGAAWSYNYVYTNYRLIDLPFDSVFTWILGFFTVDLVYYLIHRLTHQVSFFWAIHEVHHSSEIMVLSTTMRNPVLYFVTFWGLFNPFALFIPTTINLVHHELGLICQLWVHTDKIGKLPWLIEYIFNTPSHHRVHHGRNRKYIDKNFARVLIIWDRLLGTYAEEDPEDKPVFGCTKPTETLNPLVTQVKPFYELFKKASSYDGLKNKLSAFIKGPGWSPGKPWSGDLEDIPHPPPDFQKYKPAIPMWAEAYILVHFIVNTGCFIILTLFTWALTPTCIKLLYPFVLYSIFVFGFLQDNSPYVIPFELFRHVFFFLMNSHVVTNVPQLMGVFSVIMFISRSVFIFSTLMWITIGLNNKRKKDMLKEKIWDYLDNPFSELWPNEQDQISLKSKPN